MTTLDQYNKKQARQARQAAQREEESLKAAMQARQARHTYIDVSGFCQQVEVEALAAVVAAAKTPQVGDTMERKLYPWTPKQGMQVTFPFWNGNKGSMDDVHGFVIHVYHNLDFILSSDPIEVRNPARYAYCTVPGIF